MLETALGSLMSLVHAGEIELPWLIERMTAAPARFLGRSDLGTLRGPPLRVTKNGRLGSLRNLAHRTRKLPGE